MILLTLELRLDATRADRSGSLKPSLLSALYTSIFGRRYDRIASALCDSSGARITSKADNKLQANEGLNSTSRPPLVGAYVRGSEITSCWDVAPRNAPPVTNAWGAVYCKMGSLPHTGRAESCNAGVPLTVTEKTTSAESASPAVPHHSTLSLIHISEPTTLLSISYAA